MDRSGERVADSSRPLVPCVHWGGTRKRRGRGGKKRQELMRRASEVNRANSRVLNHFSECSTAVQDKSKARWECKQATQVSQSKKSQMFHAIDLHADAHWTWGIKRV